MLIYYFYTLFGTQAVSKDFNNSVSRIPEIKICLRCGDQGGLDALTQWIEKFNDKKRKEVRASNLIDRGYIVSPNDLEIHLPNWNPIRIVSKHIGPFNQSDEELVKVGNVSFIGFGTFLPEVCYINYFPHYLTDTIETTNCEGT